MFPCGAPLPLDSCTFPNLRSFVTTREPSAFASFVRRHPQLQELHISPSDERSISPSEFSGICLSLLKSVCLPKSLLLMISSEAPLRSVLSTGIDDDKEEIPNYIRHLSRYCSTLSEFHFCHRGSDAYLLPNISTFIFTRMAPGLLHQSNVNVSFRCAPKVLQSTFMCAVCKCLRRKIPSCQLPHSKSHATKDDCALLLFPTTEATSKRSNNGATMPDPQDLCVIMYA